MIKIVTNTHALAACLLSLGAMHEASAATNSDLAASYYESYTGNFQLKQVEVTTLPPKISDALSQLGVRWKDLPGALQRAALWEHGYVLSADKSGELVKVYTKCGNSMADIAIAKEDTLMSENSGGLLQCGMRFRSDYNKSSPPPLMTAIKCATSKVTTTSTGSFWAEGSIQTELEPRVYKHDGGSWTIYAIHATKDTTSSGCDATTSVVVPCVLEDGGGWCDPTPSSAFSVNLKLFASGGPKGGTSTSGSNGSGSKKSSTTYIIVGVVVAVVIAIVAGLVYRRRRARRASTENSVHESEGSKTHNQDPRPSPATDDAATGDHYQTWNSSIQTNSVVTATTATMVPLSEALASFFSSRPVQLHRLDYAKLHIGDTIAKGGFGEVCLGSYEGRRVAVKRLVRHKRREVAEVESFAEEIQLMCKLKHPNINTFYGVAWNNIHDLCIATEFATHGDLRSFLQKRTPMELPWHREKIRFVLDIGEALIYLHSLQPKVIHRDIKSKNMLISEDMRAKLIDFGASRERILDETMTAGVGTVRWTAPEVLSGSPYSEKADIYAFGVVLVEIDTHLLPYDRQVNQAGNRIGDMEIAAGVITANLRPEFSSSCPSAIKQLGEWCMLKDQDRRPTAMELVYHIQQRVIPLLPTQASRVPDWD